MMYMQDDIVHQSYMISCVTKFSIMVFIHSRYEYVMKTCKVWHIFLILSKLFKGENKKIIGVFWVIFQSWNAEFYREINFWY